MNENEIKDEEKEPESTQNTVETPSAPEEGENGHKEDIYAFHWNYEENDAKSEKAKKNAGRGVRTYAIVMTIAFALCFGMLAAVLFIDDISNITQTIKTERTVFIREDKNGENALTVSEIAEKMKPSVVAIEVTKPTKTSIGSGIIISEDGYIATNSHLVAGGTSVRVIMQDGTEFEAEIVGKDELSDVAVIKVDKTGLTPAVLGDSDALIVGEHVTAIGTPAGLELIGSVTDGIISGVNRDVKIYDDTGALQKTMKLVQTNASINSGNSGGPLVNDAGEVIGIVTMKLTDGFDGVGFAIPINGAKKIIDEIIEKGGDTDGNSTDVAKKRALIGITGKAVTPAEGFATTGVYVAEVNENSDAANYLEVGDIIVGIDGNEVITVADISSVISDLSAGDTVLLTVSRAGRRFECSVMLTAE